MRQKTVRQKTEDRNAVEWSGSRFGNVSFLLSSVFERSGLLSRCWVSGGFQGGILSFVSGLRLWSGFGFGFGIGLGSSS
jgi:hypothetical protein